MTTIGHATILKRKVRNFWQSCGWAITGTGLSFFYRRRRQGNLSCDRTKAGHSKLRNLVCDSLTMLKESVTENLFAQLFDSQPDSVVWFAPVFDSDGNNQVTDFEARYCNRTAAQILGVSPAQVVGDRLRSTTLLDDSSVKLIFQQCLDVWQTGEP